MRQLLLLVFFLGTSTANAAAVVLDFESQSVDGWNSGTGPITDNGFILATENIGIAEWIGASPKVANFCTGYCSLSPLLISKADGNAFDLHSFDMAAYGLLVVSDFTMTGQLAGGGFVETIINLTATVNDAAGAMQSFVFDDSWSNLSSVTISYDASFGFSSTAIDNISVSTVPIPAAVWLFGSALAGLGWMRRKSTRLD
jgi:hypothetical protein